MRRSEVSERGRQKGQEEGSERASATPEAQGWRGGPVPLGRKAALRPEKRALPSDRPSRSLPLSDARPSVAPRVSHQRNVCN